MTYDSTENLVKIGIVSGSSATRCNKWFCYDLATGTWSEDVYTHQLGEFREIEADSGNLAVIQMGMIPSTSNGSNWYLCEILLRLRVQSAGSYTWTIEENDVEEDDGTGEMTAEHPGETMRRNRHQLKAHNTPWVTFTIQANTLDQPIYLYDMAVLADIKEYK